MELDRFFKSVVDSDNAPVVICNLEHKIIYLNKTALKRYEKRGGAALIGQSLFACHNEKSCKIIEETLAWFAESQDNNCHYTGHNPKENRDTYIIALRDDNGQLIGYYEKHEYRTLEAEKA